MCNNSFFPNVGAAALILIVLAVMAGFFLASPPPGDAAFLPQQADQLFWSTGHGDDGDIAPAFESSYSDYNPSCSHAQTLPVYRPTTAPLVHFENFTAPAAVYLERFVPPQNLRDNGRIS